MPVVWKYLEMQLQYLDKKRIFIFLLQYLLIFLSQYCVQKYCEWRGPKDEILWLILSKLLVEIFAVKPEKKEKEKENERKSEWQVINGIWNKKISDINSDVFTEVK